jgi:hypothetical protein
MPELLFKLRGVPDDEAEDIRQLLNDRGIDYYETHASGWGISMPGIWLHDAGRLEEAKSVIDAYQKERARLARERYEQQKRDGESESVIGRVLRHPIQFLLLTMALLFILYISLRPFLQFGT